MAARAARAVGAAPRGELKSGVPEEPMGELSGDPEGSTEEKMRRRRPECGQLEGSGRRNMAAIAEPWFVPSLDDARRARLPRDELLRLQEKKPVTTGGRSV